MLFFEQVENFIELEAEIEELDEINIECLNGEGKITQIFMSIEPIFERPEYCHVDYCKMRCEFRKDRPYLII